MSLSGLQVTRQGPDGGVGPQYGSFFLKTSGTKTYSATFTRQGGSGTPAIRYGSFSGKGTSLNLGAETGSFALTGQSALFGISQPSAEGSFTLTGQDATLRYNEITAAGTGTFVVTGFDTDPENTILRIGMRAGEGIFFLTGQDAELIATGGLSVIGDTGSFTLTGIDTPLDVKMPGGAQSFTENGQSALFRITLQTDYGGFALSGQSAGLAIAMPAEYDVYSYVPQPATFNVSLVAETGTFAVDVPGEGIQADVGTFTVSGQDAPLGLTLTAEHGTYSLTGQDALSEVGGNVVLSAEAGVYTLSGQDANLTDRSQEPMTYGGVAKRRTYRYFGSSYDEERQDIRAIVAEETPNGVVHKEILWKPDVTYADFQKEIAALQANLIEDEEMSKALKKLQRRRNQRKVIALLLQ